MVPFPMQHVHGYSGAFSSVLVVVKGVTSVRHMDLIGISGSQSKNSLRQRFWPSNVAICVDGDDEDDDGDDDEPACGRST